VATAGARTRDRRACAREWTDRVDDERRLAAGYSFGDIDDRVRHDDARITADTIRRIVAFTAAGGGNYFYIDQPVTVTDNGQKVTYTSTIVPNNTATSATFSFPDAVLLSGIAIDVARTRELVRRCEQRQVGVVGVYPDDGPAAVRLTAGCPVDFVVAVPEDELPTKLAREALPETIAHADAAYTTARAVLLVAALESGRPELLADALDDRLHEPYRAPFVPLLGAVRDRLGGLPAYGATISGAGPSVLVWCERGAAAAVADSLAGVAPRILRLSVADAGVQIS
jgi:hypothetical protein